MQRGEVHIAAFPTADGTPPKDRPCIAVQADYYNQRITHVIVVPVTTNLKRRNDPAHALIDVSTIDGKASGLHTDSVVSGLNVTVMLRAHLRKKIGELSPHLMLKVEECLKKALGI